MTKVLAGVLIGLLLFELGTEGILSNQYRKTGDMCRAKTVRVFVRVLPYAAAAIGFYLMFKCIISL